MSVQAPREPRKPVALVFIHGMGVQDRYQQLVAFTQGLEQTATGGAFRVSRRDKEGATACDEATEGDTTQRGADRPMGRFLPLCVEPDGQHLDDAPRYETTAVDVHEVYWAPLLNGLTSSWSVIRWAYLTLVQGDPARSDIPTTPEGEAKVRGVGTAPGKGRHALACLIALTILGAALLYWSVGAVLLSTDQLAEHGKAEAAQREGRVVAEEAGPFRLRETGEERHRLLYERPAFQSDWPELMRKRQLASVSFVGQAFYHPFSRGSARLNIPVISPDAGLLESFTLWDLVLGGVYLLTLFWALKQTGSVLGLLLYKLPRRRVRLAADQRDLWGRLWTHTWKALALWLVLLPLIALSKLIITLVVLPITVYQLVVRLIRLGVRDVLGDVEIYVNRNENSRLYAGREAVLARTRQTLEQILDSPRYDAVYIAGHSLGSVIGLDTLRRLYTEYALAYGEEQEESRRRRPGEAAALDPEEDWRRQASEEAARRAFAERERTMLRYEKIRAYITFGSPLEKTLLFLHREDYKAGFGEFSRRVDWRLFRVPAEAAVSRRPARPHCYPWFNFWIWYDIVCDPLCHYPIDHRHHVEVQTPRRETLWPHSDYWRETLFVRNVLRILTWKDRDNLDAMVLEDCDPGTSAGKEG